MSDFDPNFQPTTQYAIVGQKAVISNTNNEILLLQRSEKSGLGGKWSLPGGGLDRGEKSEKGILREIEEETQVFVNNPKPFYVKTYINKNDDFIVIIAYRAKLRSKKIVLNWEHDDYKWLTKKEALKMDLSPDAEDIINNWTQYDSAPLTTAKDVLNLYSALKEINVDMWLDGGWGIDALLEKQTRDHDDVDIVIQKKDIKKLNEYLQNQGFSIVERDDSSPENFVFGNERGHLIDIHVVVFDDEGNGIYGPPENGNLYPKDSFSGEGIIDGKLIKCLTAEYQVKSHTGYKLRDYDFQDMKAITKKFEIKLPEEYE
jgi:lincosamide nucleotidyltransferase A/C/D/E